MTTKSSSFEVRQTLLRLIDVVSFGVNINGIFNPFRGDLYWDNNKLMYEHNGHVRTLCSLIRTLKHIQTARWLNHLVFKDGFGNIISFKKFVATNYDNVLFT